MFLQPPVLYARLTINVRVTMDKKLSKLKELKNFLQPMLLVFVLRELLQYFVFYSRTTY